MTKFEKVVMYFLLVLVSCLVVWQIRDFFGNRCEKRCFEYCDNFGIILLDINKQLQDLELIK